MAAHGRRGPDVSKQNDLAMPAGNLPVCGFLTDCTAAHCRTKTFFPSASDEFFGSQMAGSEIELFET